MIAQDNSVRNLEQRSGKETPGWSALHSWIFLAVVAVGFVVLGWQNRYHYLSPLGLGKAYRIDKLFGGIQEFDPSGSWITAQLQLMPPPQAMSMMEPPSPGSQAVPMNMPGSGRPPFSMAEPQVAAGPDAQKEENLHSTSPKEVPGSPASIQPPSSSAKQVMEGELGKEEKFRSFQKVFPEFGQDEFQLATDDLYPDWKKNVAPNGNWNEFLAMYKDFILWWNDAGSPPEPVFKLWKDFLAGGSRR